MKKKKGFDIPVVRIDINYGNEITVINSHPYDIMTNKIMFGTYFPDPRFYEIEILEYLMSQYHGGVALDIGANIGNHSVFFSKFIFDKTIAFEPNYRNFSILKENKSVNNISDEKLVIYNAALSDGNYKYKLIEYGGSNNMGGSTIEEGDGELTTVKLDDIELPKIDLIKLDVEGHELKVLKGGMNLINRDFPDIILESMENGRGAPEKIDPFMKSIGYRMVESFGYYCMYYYKHL